MKAQSELMGDHERATEMTAPRRKAEQQTWMRTIDQTIKNMDTMQNTIAACADHEAQLASVSATILNKTPDINPDTYEVKYCPAGQQ